MTRIILALLMLGSVSARAQFVPDYIVNGGTCSGVNFVQVTTEGSPATCSQPSNVTGNSATATALAANGTNCSSGQAPLGVDASGNSEGCFTPSGASIGGTVTSGTTGSVLFVGSGPVLAQDNSHFFWDDTNDRLGIGTTTPSTQLEVRTTDTSATRGNLITQINSGSHPASQQFQKARGTPGSETTVVDQDYVGTNTFDPYVSTSGYLHTATYGTRINGTVTGTSAPTDIFWATSGGGDDVDPYGNNHVRMKIAAAGGVIVGSNVGGTAPTHALDVVGTLAATGNVTGANLSGTNTGDQTITLTSDVTGSGTGSITATIPADTVTNAKLADMAAHTIKANITAGSANPLDSSLSAILDAEAGSTQGQILYRGASAWTVLSPGTSGHVLITGGASANPSWGAAGSSSGGAMTFVGATTLGSAQTTITSPTLDLNAAGRYHVKVTLTTNTAGSADVYWYFNSDTTNANYDKQLQQIDGSQTLSRSNNPAFGTMHANDFMEAEADVWNGIDVKPVVLLHYLNDSTTAINTGFCGIKWRTASTNVTAIVISSTTSNAFATGSKIEVWKIGT